MNTLFAFLLAGTLHTTTPVVTPAANPTNYAVSDQMAVWVSADHKLHLILGRNPKDAHVQLIGGTTEYVRQWVGLSKQAAAQRYDLSALPAGTYHLQIRIGRQVVEKEIVINEPAAQRLVTLD